MTNTEHEMREIIKRIDPAIIDTLTILAADMLEKQKDQETQKYESLLISPFEVSEIVTKQGCSDTMMIDFAMDAIKYYRANLLGCDTASAALWIAGFLIEAGRIIGIRQERAKKAV